MSVGMNSGWGCGIGGGSMEEHLQEEGEGKEEEGYFRYSVGEVGVLGRARGPQKEQRLVTSVYM